MTTVPFTDSRSGYHGTPTRSADLLAYQPSLMEGMIQVFVEASQDDMHGAAVSFSDTRSLLNADSARQDYDARIVRSVIGVAGFVAWHRSSAWQLSSYVRARFDGDLADFPHEDGAFMSRLCAPSTRQDTGLVRVLLESALDAIDGRYTWSALALPRMYVNKASVFGFIDTGLTALYDNNLCLMLR